MNIKHRLNSILAWKREFNSMRFTEGRERRLMKLNGIPNVKAAGEDEYMQYWKGFSRYKTHYAYRLYSHFCGPTKEILSEPVTEIINDTLNPQENQLFYKDKNNFSRVFPADAMPATIARRHHGITLDSLYRPISLSATSIEKSAEGAATVVIKPSFDSCSGKGVKLFHLSKQGYRANDGTRLDEAFLKHYDAEYIIQKGIRQHPELDRLNPTSVNTLRFMTYRSVVDNNVHLIYCAIRVGKKGSEVDNAHAGGSLMPLDHKGKSVGFFQNEYCQRFPTHNDIDLRNTTFTCPHFDKAIDFCKEIALATPDLHLLQHDIAIDSSGKPLLIEINCSGYASWVPQTGGVTGLGNFTEEAVDYVMWARRLNRVVTVL